MHFLGKQKVPTLAATILLACGVSFVGAQWARPAAPLDVRPLSGETKPIVEPKATEPKPVETPTPVEAPRPAPKEVVVAVAGAVKRGGLLHLPLDARVDDAIKAAGGAKPDADLETINLAAKAVDGDQIYVPHKAAEPAAHAEQATKVAERYRGGEVRPAYSVHPIEPAMPPTLTGTPGASHPTKAKASGPVSLNTGSEAQLETLPGVGPSTAQKILAYRQEHGGFGSVEEIQSVKGIGPKKFEKMKPFLKL